MKDFKDKIAVVTGGASGIGRGMAESFIAAGMKVVLSDIDAPALENTTRALRATGADVHAVLADVSKPGEVDDLARQTLSTYGAVHVLCNNAGVFEGGATSWESSLEDWQWIVGVNLMGVVHGIRSFLPIMIAQDTEAHVVNTASVGGLVAMPGALDVTTKFGVVGLSEVVYKELHRGRFKPRISVLCPGVVDTNILDSRRNRPAGLADPSPPVGPAVDAARARDAKVVKEAGMSPRAVGEQVLAAIREERFYVLTHPEFNSLIEVRTTLMLSGRNPTTWG